MRSVRSPRALWLTLIALHLFAASLRPQEAPRFALERIVVAGLERAAAREIVVAESRLIAGESYNEAELHDALHRVRRLPFVLSAELALQRGSARGLYELVLSVTPATPLFYEASVVGFYDPDDDPGSQDDLELGGLAQVGARRFVGRQGLLFGTVQAIEGVSVVPVQLGYTRYGLFGRGGYASVGLFSLLGERHSEQLEGTLSAGLPLDGNDALRATVSGWRHETTRFGGSRITRQSVAELAWVHDTTDDPLLPTRGSRWELATSYASSRFEDSTPLLGGDPAAPSPRRVDRNEVASAALRGSRRYRLSPGQSLAARGGLSHQRYRSPQQDELTALHLGVAHALDLGGGAGAAGRGERRLEITLDLARQWARPADGLRVETHLEAGVFLLLRHPWGVVRGGVLWRESLERW